MKTEIHTLKGLKTQLSKATAELKVISDERSRLQSEYDRKRSLIDRLNREIAALTSADIIVSEHAVLRYIERVLGINTEELKTNILPEKTKEQIKVLGSGKYPVEGHRLVVKDNVVVTVE